MTKESINPIQNPFISHAQPTKSWPIRSCLYSKKSIVAYRPVAKQWLSKQRPLLGNVRNMHEPNRTRLCNMFLGNRSVNTLTIGTFFKTASSIQSVRSSYAEEFSSESAVEFRSSQWAVSQELGRCSWEFRCGVLTSGQRKLKNPHY
jgi:hypothetical protein